MNFDISINKQKHQIAPCWRKTLGDRSADESVSTRGLEGLLRATEGSRAPPTGLESGQLPLSSGTVSLLPRRHAAAVERMTTFLRRWDVKEP